MDTITPDMTEKVINMLLRQGGEDAVEKFLSGDLVVIPRPRFVQQDGAVYLTVATDGRSGSKWKNRLRASISDEVKEILSLESFTFKPTLGVTTEIVVLKDSLFPDPDRITENIHKFAKVNDFDPSDLELACATLDTVTGEDLKAMGLRRIVFMSEPVEIKGILYLLSVFLKDNGETVLEVSQGKPSFRWFPGTGFAYVNTRIGARAMW